MHRFYEFDVTDILADGENEIKIICYSPNNYVKAKHLSEAVPESQEPLRGFSYLRKCMSKGSVINELVWSFSYFILFFTSTVFVRLYKTRGDRQ